MKIAFFSSTLNHHQLPLSLAIEKLIGKGNYVFVASTPLTKERIALGFPDYNNQYDFVLKTYEDKKKYADAFEMALNFDVVIFGMAPEYFVKERMKKNKLTFRYHERIFRVSRLDILKTWTFRTILFNHTRYFDKNLYMLCASAYTAGDYRLGGAYRNKCFRWGYFPTTEIVDIPQLLTQKSKKKIKLLWIGRFLSLKQPEMAIFAAEYLLHKGFEIHLDIIGTGSEEDNLLKLIEEKKIENYIKIHHSMSSDKVREYMKNAHIFLFTSNRKEGWGVVLNEAMNSGCAVLANNEIGSVPYLINDGENGYVYNTKNEMFLKAEKLAADEALRNKFAQNAYNTIVNEWNAENAARKLIVLIEDLLTQGKGEVFPSGVLSIDKIML
jgi:glycosyltransferase involved in cell wall biosynthesis